MNRDPITINGKEWLYDPATRTHRRAEDIERADGNTNMAAVPAAAAQRNRRDARNAKAKGCAISQRVDIEIRTFRVHSCDTEAVCIKHANDAIVSRGVISDDSAEEVASIKFFACEKVAEYEEEGHLITLRVCE